MNIHDILEYAKGNFTISSEMDWEEFDRCLKKRKLIMKKNHAKNRNSNGKKPEYYVISDTVEGVDAKDDEQAQIKKKRNRVSAQVSRDRKKLKIQELELNNKKLKAETEKMVQEN